MNQKRFFNKAFKFLSSMGINEKRQIVAMLLLQEVNNRKDGLSGEDFVVKLDGVSVSVSYDVGVEDEKTVVD